MLLPEEENGDTELDPAKQKNFEISLIAENFILEWSLCLAL